MKMDYNSATAMDYTVGITGQMVQNGQVIRYIRDAGNRIDC